MRQYKHHIYQIVFQVIVFGSFFLNLFKETVNEQVILLTGYQAMNGNFVIGSIFSISMILLVGHIIALLNKETYKKIEPGLIALINIQMILAAILITFYSAMLHVLGMIFIGVLVASVYVQHQIKTN